MNIKRTYNATGVQYREATNDSPATIEGYAIIFDSPSCIMGTNDGVPVREIIDRGAVTRELLDGCDIKMTLYHSNKRLLARSKQGKGTLTYDIDGHGVRFSFPVPDTVDGDTAKELVRSGIIDGCSFAFTVPDVPGAVAVEHGKHEGNDTVFVRVCQISAIYDFTLTPDPAYESTDCAYKRDLNDYKAISPAYTTAKARENRALIIKIQDKY